MAGESLIVIGIAIFCVLLGIFVWLVWGKIKQKIEKTPYGRQSKKLMIFVKPTNVKREFFKEARLNGSNAIFLDKDFKNETPSFFARERHDYFWLKPQKIFELYKQGFLSKTYANWILREIKTGYLVYLSRLDKQGITAIEKEDWNRIFEVSEEEQYGEKWYLDQRAKNVAISDAEYRKRSADKATATTMDKDYEMRDIESQKKLLNYLLRKGKGIKHAREDRTNDRITEEIY